MNSSMKLRPMQQELVNKLADPNIRGRLVGDEMLSAAERLSRA
jgi:hypothetical protein